MFVIFLRLVSESYKVSSRPILNGKNIFNCKKVNYSYRLFFIGYYKRGKKKGYYFNEISTINRFQ